MAMMDGKHMTKDQVRSTEEAFSTARALDLALEALEYHTAQTRPIQRTETAITAIKQARSAPVQDQIKAITQEAMQKIHDLEDQVRREVYNIPPNVATPLAAQRQSARSAWVGLTDDEIDDLAEFHGLDFMSYDPFTRAILAKIKEKNSG